MDRKFLWFGMNPDSNIKDILDIFLREGFAGWGWVYTGDLSDLIDKDWTEVKKELKKRLWESYKTNPNFTKVFGTSFEEFDKIAEKNFNDSGGNLKSFEYLLHKEKRVKPGDIIAIRSGNHLYAIGVALSGYVYNEKLREDDLSHGVRVKWLIFNKDLSPISKVSTQSLAPIRYIGKDKPLVIDLLKKYFNVRTDEELEVKLQEILREVLNAQKFREED